MAKQRHLKNAPIVEAVIDIQVILPSNIEVADLRTIHKSISKQYPKETERIKGSFELKMGKTTGAMKQDVSHYGYAYSTDDNTQIDYVVQARLDGFTLSRLKPYDSWQQLSNEARKLWQLYVKIALPEKITRIAVRYINRLEFPLPIESLSNYITAPPNLPSSLPQVVSEFLTRVVVPLPDTNITAIITQASEPVAQENLVKIILDIDIFETLKEGQEERLNIDNIWKTFEELHDLKNRFFFESITEEMASLCN